MDEFVQIYNGHFGDNNSHLSLVKTPEGLFAMTWPPSWDYDNLIAKCKEVCLHENCCPSCKIQKSTTALFMQNYQCWKCIQWHNDSCKHSSILVGMLECCYSMFHHSLLRTRSQDAFCNRTSANNIPFLPYSQLVKDFFTKVAMQIIILYCWFAEL